MRPDISNLTDSEVIALLHDWEGLIARDKQRLPKQSFENWLVLAGRGFGKTRTGAETVRLWCESNPIIHLVGATAGDVRDVMIEGPAGLMNIFPPGQTPHYEPSKRKITFYNGSYAVLFSAEEPNRLRGPQCYKAWADELAAWKYDDAWDQLQFGLRLGDHPQCVITTTPRPTEIIRGLVKDAETFVTKGSTFENKHNLSPSFLRKMQKKYEGTTLGRQELYAEILEDVEGALWTIGLISEHRVNNMPDLVRAVVALDPSASSRKDSDEAGIIAAGVGRDGDYYVFEDGSGIFSPDEQSRETINLYKKYNLDALVYEKNNGGDWIPTVIKGIDKNINTQQVWASRGKETRAEPVAALYEQGKVHHVGNLPKLENEMTTWVPKLSKSPNRVDALVWAISYLMTGGKLRIIY